VQQQQCVGCTNLPVVQQQQCVGCTNLPVVQQQQCVGCTNLPVVQQQQCALINSSTDKDETDNNNLPYRDNDSTEDLDTELVTDEFLLDSVII